MKAVERTKNYQEIITQLLSAIASGELKIGEALPSERSLATTLQVSRASLREALSALEVMGVLRIRQGGQTTIAPFDVRSLVDLLAPLMNRYDRFDHDLHQFRRLLECEAVTLIEEDVDLTRLGMIIDQMNMEFSQDERIASHLDIAFHRELFNLTQNQLLIQVISVVESILTYSVVVNREHILSLPKNREVLLKQHNEIFTAIVSQEKEVAKMKMKEHLDFVLKMSKVKD